MAESKRYHINPETGNANLCKAQYSCKFGDADNRHFDDKDAAQKFFEHIAEAESIDPEKTLKEIGTLLPVDDGTNSSRTVEQFILGKLMENPYTVSDSNKENLLALKKMADLAGRGDLTDEEFASLRDMYYRMSSTPYGYSTSQRRKAEDDAHALGAYLYARTKAARTTIVPVDGREQQDRIIGLFDAQNEFVNIVNGGTSPFANERDERYIAVGAVSYAQETIDRFLAGQRVEADLDDVRQKEHFSQNIYPVRDRLLAMVDRDNSAFNQQTYFGLVFPEKELKGAFEKYGVNDVTVTPLDNGRETGLSYTVLEPNGNTRTFSVYEHRNTDSMIINGKTNVRNGALPYVRDTSHKFFAEVSGDEDAPQRVADRLAFFCQQAQRGELPDDDTLARQADRLDWTSILSNQIPGFKKWAQDQGMEVHDPNDTSDEAVLRNLDFEA